MDCIEEVGELTWDQQNVDDDYLLARMMLGGLSMLDFDEIMEYRDPPFPSQRGPPRCLAVKRSNGDSIEIFVLECDICHEPLRGLAWTCRLGCRSSGGTDGASIDPLDVCMKCYNEVKHPRQHLVRSPRRYSISEALRAELSGDDFKTLRREIQRNRTNLIYNLIEAKAVLSAVQ